VQVTQAVESPAGWSPNAVGSTPPARSGPLVSASDSGNPAPGDEESYRRSRFGPAEPSRARMHDRHPWKRASTKRKAMKPASVSVPATRLRALLRELGGAVLQVLEALEAGRWPDDGGAALARRRFLAVTAIRTSGLGPDLERTRAVLEGLGTLLEGLHLRA